MDLDAGADDFFAALDNGVAEDVFAGFEAAATSDRLSVDDEPLVMIDRNKKAEEAKKAAKKEAAARAAAARATRLADEPALPMEERIVNLLVPELKVNDVMLLIRKMRQAGKSDADEFSELDAEQKTAPRFRCETCGNTEQNNFITDYARGDTICNGLDGNGCGTVVQDHIVHEGSAYRKFEGEEDKSHHGPAPNKLFSTGHNLRTLISQDGEMAGNLRRAAEFVEMNLSQMGKDERRTRIGYKDQMKQKACRLIDHTMSNLDLHEIVGSRAKKMFAEFRDVREHVHQFDAMVAGCVIAAYMETSKEMYSAQNGIRIGHNKQAGIANLALLPNKAVDETKLHPFTCFLCNMKFNARRGMQFHKCAGKSEEDKAKARSATSLTPMVLPDQIQAIVEIKNGKTWYKCPVCSRVYGKEDSLTEHMIRHKNQSKKRLHHIENHTIDPTRLAKTTKLASANPSVQVNTHEQVMFRGEGRRVWLQHLTEKN
ncbi:putative transcription factor TFIIB, Zinc finger C2H2-type, Zinc finger C2H2 superfamily [Plasmopara halstedii]